MAGHHVVSWKWYVGNAIALAILMFLTVYAAQFDLGSTNGLNYLIAVTIAIAKASLIVAIFMGLRWSTNLVKIFALAGFFWLLIMLSFTLTDAIVLGERPDWGTPFLQEPPEWSAQTLPQPEPEAHTAGDAAAAEHH